MRIVEKTEGSVLVGMDPPQVITFAAVLAIAAGAVQSIDKTSDGMLRDPDLGRAEEAKFTLAAQGPRGPSRQ